MQSVVFRYLVLGAALVAGGAAASLVACASDGPADTSTSDASSDAPLLGDAPPPEPDAEIPLGDVCGNAGGLEKDAPWPMRGGCPKRAGVSSSQGPQNATLKWSLPLTSASSPAIAADRLIWVGTADGDVVVLSATGILQGALHTSGPVVSSPARSATGLTIIGSTNGTLYGVERGGGTPPDDGGADAGDGGAVPPARAIFSRALAPIASSPAIGGDGTIYVGTNDGKLVALFADGSAMKWAATTNDTLGSSPALAPDGTIYVGSSDHHLYAIRPDGSPRWSIATDGNVGSPVIGGDDTIYVGSSDGKLYAVTPEGKVLWTYATGGPITGSPCVRGGVVYVGSDDKKLHAIDSPSGTRKWTYDTLGAVATPVVGPDAHVYFGSADGNLYALNPTGLLFFAVRTKGRITSAPAIGDDGTLYVTTDNALVAIGP